MTDMKFEEQYEQLVISQHPSKDCDECIDIEAYTNCTKLMSTPNTIIIKFPSKKEALQMRDALLEALPIDDTEEIDIELPEEPEERGFYITDKNVLIYNNKDFGKCYVYKEEQTKCREHSEPKGTSELMYCEDCRSWFISGHYLSFDPSIVVWRQCSKIFASFLHHREYCIINAQREGK